LDGKIESLNQEKEAAVAEQDFEKRPFPRSGRQDQARQERITREWSDKSKEVGASSMRK